jgi:hypothetical protein
VAVEDDPPPADRRVLGQAQVAGVDPLHQQVGHQARALGDRARARMVGQQ